MHWKTHFGAYKFWIKKFGYKWKYLCLDLNVSEIQQIQCLKTRITTLIKAKLKKADRQRNINKYKADIKHYKDALLTALKLFF